MPETRGVYQPIVSAEQPPPPGSGGVKVRIRAQGEELIIPVPDGGMIVEIIHERQESVPGVTAFTRTKPYKLCLQEKGVQLR